MDDKIQQKIVFEQKIVQLQDEIYFLQRRLDGMSDTLVKILKYQTTLMNVNSYLGVAFIIVSFINLVQIFG